MVDSLKTLDVTDCAEDNQKLKEKFRQLTGVVCSGDIENWMTANPVLVRGPYEQTTAIVIKQNGGDEYVKVFFGDEVLHTYPTHLTTVDAVIMVLLKPGYYCW